MSLLKSERSRKHVAVFALLALIIGVLPSAVLAPPAEGAQASTVSATTPSNARPAANLANFNPGHIVSDAVFFNSQTMNATQIDTFLRSKVSTCQSGYTCLKDYRQNTPNRPSDQYCAGYTGAPNESAATIISKVARSCGINPQVFIVMLQKEQGLVTHTWPSDWRYSAALGQGCPDTAPCDPQFAGFFYQIYGAGRQMKIYTEGRWFTYYAPGKTWNILYHPNSACGRGPVSIKNRATSALYYYTPYQPNAAALRAGYGEGDGCSAYGNRNFYNYFSDWFGDPTRDAAAGPSLIRATDGAAIYLAVSGIRYHVQTADDLNTLTAKFGPFAIVAPSLVAGLSDGGPVSRSVRDPRDGVVYFLEPDGSKHRFPTVEVVSAYGYDVTAAANMPPAVLDAFSTGPEVGTVFRPADSPHVFVKSDKVRRHVYDQTALSSVLADQKTYVATTSAGAMLALPQGNEFFGNRRLIRASTSPATYFTTPGTLVHVPSLELASAFGASSTVTEVAAASISGYPVAKDMLRPAVACDGEVRVLDGTDFRRVNDSSAIVSTKLSAGDCAALPAPSGSTIDKAFVKSSGAAAVYTFDGSTVRHVISYNDLLALNGERASISTVSWSEFAMNAYGVGKPLLARDGAVISFTGSPEVYVLKDGSLRWATTWASLVALAGAAPQVDMRAPEQRALFTIGKPYLAERSYVRFGSASEIYLMRDGALSYIPTWDTLLGSNNGKVPAVETLAPSLRGQIPEAKAFVLAGTFVRFGDAPEIYLMEDGDLHHIQTYEALIRHGKGDVPPIISIPGSAKDFTIGVPYP
ncbi:hypothetical protein [Microbacterium sp. OR16]|uniref:hypothetical protein n=1 Tax=Microbacterium sp. OR16 TaxID=3095345 RepID=UPI0039B4AC84